MEMAFVFDPIIFTNLIFCVGIMTLSIWWHRRSHSLTPLYIGLAFGLFAVSHAATLLDLKTTFEEILIVDRVGAYVLVFIGLFFTARDALRRQEAEEALKLSERRLSDIIDFLPDPTFVIDLEGRVLAWNRAIEETTGVKAADILGKGDFEYSIPFYGARQPALLDLVVHPDRDDLAEFYPEVRRKGDLIIAESYSPALNRREGVYLHVTASPLYDTGGTIIGAIESLRDITALKKAEEEILRKNAELGAAYEEMTATADELQHNYDELRRSEQALDQARKKLNLLNFIALTDIRSAVFSLAGYLQLEEEVLTDERQREYHRKLAATVENIDGLLQFARTYQDLGLDPACWQSVEQAFLLGLSHLDSLALAHSLDVDGLEVYADPLLEQVFFNLAQNVLRHGKTATEIALRYQETDDGLVLVFEDDGEGIPESQKAAIFERGIEERKGMGLFLVREVLAITGIAIRETGKPGEGARFEILVPKEAYRFTEGTRIDADELLRRAGCHGGLS